MQNIGRVVVVGCLVGLFGQVYAVNAETVAERFETAMKKSGKKIGSAPAKAKG